MNIQSGIELHTIFTIPDGLKCVPYSPLYALNANPSTPNTWGDNHPTTSATNTSGTYPYDHIFLPHQFYTAAGGGDFQIHKPFPWYQEGESVDKLMKDKEKDTHQIFSDHYPISFEIKNIILK